jgi:hypothetical protein
VIRAKLLRPAALAAAAALIALVAVLIHERHAAEPPGPRTLEEVVRLAEERSLHWRGDQDDGAFRLRVVVSDAPVTQAQANLLCLGDLRLPCWRRVVAVYTPWGHSAEHLEPGYSAVWGELVVFGDPALIRRLTGLDPDAGPSRRALARLRRRDGNGAATPSAPAGSLPPEAAQGPHLRLLEAAPQE